MSAVLEPLDFILPKREPLSPVPDLSIELDNLSTTEAEPKISTGPAFSEKVKPSEDTQEVPENRAELELNLQEPQEAELSHDSAEPRALGVEQSDAEDTTLLSSEDQNESQH